MNDILNKILSDKTPEEFAAEVAIVRKKIGPDNKYDISVEEAIGIIFEPISAVSIFEPIAVKGYKKAKIESSLKISKNKPHFNDEVEAKSFCLAA